ncbi:hypothetical protein ACH5RR_041524 [Cinchona calisaya]|uniref:C2 domain-containing protein n=1 Tax=Cinchona calisaya TaxID=153742 RepID=A0ABD2XTW6_9GENT
MNQQPSILEITAISAQGLKASSSPSSSTLFFSGRIRPFATIASEPFTYKDLSKVCKTKVAEKGGLNPTWGDKFKLHLDSTFFSQSYSCIYLHLYTKNFFFGYTQLGWCGIPISDILDGFMPAGSLRHLAYQLRARDGSRGHGIVNVAVKLESAVPITSTSSSDAHWPEMNVSKTVMGTPVTAFPPVRL